MLAIVLDRLKMIQEVIHFVDEQPLFLP